MTYSDEVTNELMHNLRLAGIDLFTSNGIKKDVNTIMNELAPWLPILPPELVNAITANFAGLKFEDSAFHNSKAGG